VAQVTGPSGTRSQTLGVMMPHVELVPIADIDQNLAEVDDWELFVALH